MMVLFGAFSNHGALANDVIELTYASYQPYTSDSYKAQEWWVKELEKRSKGKVKIIFEDWQARSPQLILKWKEKTGDESSKAVRIVLYFSETIEFGFYQECPILI